MQLHEYVGVQRRYQKSVHLERDATSAEALAGYIVTPLVRKVLRRLALGLGADTEQRAWSITGPYGTGKSALAVLWSNLLGDPREPRTKQARQLVQTADEDLSTMLFGQGLFSHGGLAPKDGLVTVLATGERAGLDEVILRAMHRSLQSFWSGRGAKPAVLRSIAAALKKAEQGKSIGVRATVELIEASAQKICESANAGSGLMIILDEAGKCLEYASHEPTRGDVQLLQELAEAANRSGAYPIHFLTILHQSIERYAGRLGAAQRNEWAKVQGRFEDLAFQEESDQLLRLIGAALVPRGSAPPGIRKEYETLAKRAGHVAGAGESGRAADYVEQLRLTFPLHPMCALILGPLFRTKLAQNERSLFSFLSSGEPLGFQAHLQKEFTLRAVDTLYTVDALYDYVVSALGTQLYGQDGRAWAEIDTALRRLPKEASACDVRVLKTIGILTIIGDQAGIRASREVLELALKNSTTTSDDIRLSLERLTASSAVVYRKYRDAFQIWEGSDLDLGELVQSAFEQTDTRAGLARRLTAIAPPRPIVARRHLFQTGTLRYFDVRYVEADLLEAEIKELVPIDADGALLIVLPRAPGDLTSTRQRVSQKMFWFTHHEKNRPIVVGIPRNANYLADLAAELAALEWVQSNTPELAKDPVARRELAARLQETERLVQDELVRLLDGGHRNGCEWFSRWEPLSIASASDLGKQISNICDQVYDKAPVVLNELLNRRQLSSAAAAARRNLIEAMIERSDRPRLGFEGHPPEVSMYRSLLEMYRIHKDTEGGWAIVEPRGKTGASLRPAWEAIEQFLASTEAQRKSIADLYEVLRQPPFGIKDGLLPVLVCAALLYFDSEVALYENGAFVPGLTTPVAERLLRWPDKFELQRFKIAGVRAKVFERFGRALLSGQDADHPTLLAIVRSLVRFIADLPDFARTTKQVSQTAQEVRRALRSAKEPGPLLFRDLPEACGCEPFGTTASTDSHEVEKFFATLRAALGELQTAYPKLLDEIESLLASTFELPADKTKLRSELGQRAHSIRALAAEAEVKSFLMRVADDALAHEEWLLSVATPLANKPPPKWNDSDLESMHMVLARIARKFRALESLAIQLGKRPSASAAVVRLSITQPALPEQERVVTVRDHERTAIASLQKALMAEVTSFAEKGLSPDGVLAALTRAAQAILRQDLEQQPTQDFHA